jgi:hypothetical protein
VTYSATGLPPGLSLDSSSGIISGTLTTGSSTPYSVTVTASDGTLTASQTFNWFVTSGVVTLTSPGDQTNNEGDNVSLQLSASDANNSTLTYQASGLPSGLSINSGTGLISGSIATGDSANGPYTVTVMATDSQGNGSTEQFNWNVNAPASVLTLTNPGNQSNAENDNVSLQINASEPGNDDLEYAANGLPVGLMIDPVTGIISGTVAYGAAEISGGQYNVTVTVNDGEGQTASQSFVWSIAATPQAPWLEYPGFQDDQTGTAVSLQLAAVSPDGEALTYSATGLPAGLSLNASTGLISGTITAAMGSYTVTATATNTSNLSMSQTFTWQVPCGSAPQVILAINGSTNDEDHVLLMNPDQAVPMVVTLENAPPGVYQVQLSVPSGMSSLSVSTVQLSNGGSTTVMLTPQQASTRADNVTVVAMLNGKEVGDAKETNEQVTFPALIQNADTPTGMKPRIPPRVLTPVTISLSAVPPPDSVRVYVGGNSSVNGEANFAGKAPLVEDPVSNAMYLSATTQTVYLVGMVQTAPAGPGGSNAGNLYLQVEAVDPTTVKVLEIGAKSSGFSVAAIPIAVYMGKPKVAQGTPVPTDNANQKAFLWGAIYPMKIVSDSGEQSDLGAVQISEVLGIDPKATGIFMKDTKAPIKWLSAASTNLADRNGPRDKGPKNDPDNLFALKVQGDIEIQRDAAGLITGKGQKIVNQYFIFSDAIMGIPANPNGKGALIIQSSGFELTYKAEKDGNNYFVYITRKAKANNQAAAGENASSATVKAQVK